MNESMFDSLQVPVDSFGGIILKKKDHVLLGESSICCMDLLHEHLKMLWFQLLEDVK